MCADRALSLPPAANLYRYMSLDWRRERVAKYKCRKKAAQI
ncbi:hypothetical protein BN1012_Phect916 [Candidatus Phaeomarinobacter ectocarpi]|uniref:Uncharacterized protein n=1 Tax=Candidatus Phaeomarinibacter ectocarpi TaxID=1458461 RepID=X5ML39_9HYPH|nr:hypothetical protein BN1012_Phect916 [Candidatus Phaeomarinobacter ectocarpi]